MASAPVSPLSPSPRFRFRTRLERGQLVVLALLVALTIGAWALTVYQARTMAMPMGIVARGAASGDAPTNGADATGDSSMAGAGAMATSGMSGMAAAGWSWDGFAAFLGTWTVMMAAMMVPAATPMLLLFRRVYAQRQAQGSAFVPTWVFAAGYFLVWAAMGGVTYVLVQLGSDLVGRLDVTDRGTWAPLALGAVLVVAGLYQLTPLKRVCLDHCRTPLGFVMQHWRDGYRGALRMGAIHGAYCLGCCWALFAVLVAAGVMSLAWMLLLTLVVFAEKVLPLGRHASRVVGAAFLLLGAVVAAGAIELPWTV